MKRSSKPESDNPPTDFTEYLAQRLHLTHEAAEVKLASWLVHYVPLQKRESGAGLAEERSPALLKTDAGASQQHQDRQRSAA